MLAVDVEKHFAKFALSVEFRAAGGATALFGPSGAGKTSVVNMIAGLLRPDRGAIMLDDTVLFDAARGIDVPPHRRRRRLPKRSRVSWRQPCPSRTIIRGTSPGQHAIMHG